MSLNAMKRHAGAMDGQEGVSRFAIVKAVDPARHLVRVGYDEEGTLSGWLPVLHSFAGAGSAAGSLPLVGSQVFVHADMGAVEHGVVAGGTHSSAQPPGKVLPYTGNKPAVPQDWTPGEYTIVGGPGVSLRVTSTHIEITGPLKLQGSLIASDQIMDQDGRRGTLDALRMTYDLHTHRGVQSGQGHSGIPDQLTVDGPGTTDGAGA